MSSIRGYVAGCHPAPSLVVTGIASALAASVGRGAAGSVLVGVTVLVGQLSIGWSNDWLDADRDVASARTDKPAATGVIRPAHLRTAAFVALATCIPLSFASGWAAGWAHLGLVGSGWAYNLGLKRTWVSWVPYAIGFGLLPAFVTLGLASAPWPPWWVVMVGSLLGVAAHFANVLPDIDDDVAQGILGFPQRIGRHYAGVVALTLLVVATLIVLLAPVGTPSLLGWIAAGVVGVVAGVGYWSLRRTNVVRRVFSCAMTIAVVDVVIFVTATSRLYS
ncbi:MAG TPA: UbiA family prenyltransferase [Actinomycetes bacterium]|nr:UbiA family prenyltransferase [Actinomycetes bacterium]